MDNSWRASLAHDSRQKIVKRIMDTLQRHMPVAGQDGVDELLKIAWRFEEKIFQAATDRQDYLRKISLKMLSLETKANGNPLQQNPQQQNQQQLPTATPTQSQQSQQSQPIVPQPGQSVQQQSGSNQQSLQRIGQPVRGSISVRRVKRSGRHCKGRVKYKPLSSWSLRTETTRK